MVIALYRCLIVIVITDKCREKGFCMCRVYQYNLSALRGPLVPPYQVAVYLSWGMWGGTEGIWAPAFFLVQQLDLSE